jgi:hypothetical protein
MRVVSLPLKLKMAAIVLLLAIPFAGLETVLVAKAPWWHLPLHSIEIWCLATAMLVVPLISWILAGRGWAVKVTGVAGIVWCVLSAWVSIRTRDTVLALFTVSLGLAWYLYFQWLKRETGRSYFDPRISWYQSLPKPLSGVVCKLASGDKAREVRVSRIDHDGAFLFSERGGIAMKDVLALVFSFRGREIHCRANAVKLMDDGMGAGVRFVGMSPDERKELGDFLEMLRGEGHE